jgi:hypothetical protein
MEGKVANATRGGTCGKRFSRKKDNPRNLGFGPQTRGPKKRSSADADNAVLREKKDGQGNMPEYRNARPKLRRRPSC